MYNLNRQNRLNSNSARWFLAREGYSPSKIKWGSAARFPKPLPYFIWTRISDIPNPIYELTRNSKPYL